MAAHLIRLRRPSARRLAVIAAAAMVALNVIVPGGAHPAPGSPATFDAIDGWLAHQIADAGIPGGAVVIVRDGHIVHAQGFGVADDAGRPVEAGTPFVIGSLSKSMTALAVMQLVDAGRVDLDRPVADYVPGLRLAGVARPAITVRQLLDQTSGIPTSAGITPLADPATTLAARVAELAAVAPAAAPGAAFAYSNANYLVLGRLVETVTGQPFGSYLGAHIFGPLGMTTATTDHAAAVADGLTRAHRLWFGLPDSHEAPDRPDLAPAGFIEASADDLGRFLVAQLGGAPDGGRGTASVISPEALRLMHEGVVGTGVAGERYAMGWVDGTLEGVRVVSHAGSTTDMAALQALVPDQGLGVAVLLNAQSPFYELLHKPDAIGQGVLALALGQTPGGTLELFYPVLDVVLIALLLWQVRGLLRLVRRPPATAGGWRTHPLGKVAATGFRTYLDVVVPVAIVSLVPHWLGPWPVVVRTDLGFVLVVVVVLRLADGAIRVRRLTLGVRRPPLGRPVVRRRRSGGAVGLR